MSKAEEWQSTDSGYLNCIGVGDTYVRKQIERILNGNYLKARQVYWWPTDNNDSFCINAINPQFVEKDDKELMKL